MGTLRVTFGELFVTHAAIMFAGALIGLMVGLVACRV